jgi:sec-independent protein translocase protein TatB
MFNIGFGEILLIAVVALIVLGPERLPRVARMAGALLRRARTSWQSVRDEVERELAAEEIKRNLHDMQRDVDVRADVKAAAADIDDALRGVEPRTTPPNERN